MDSEMAEKLESCKQLGKKCMRDLGAIKYKTPNLKVILVQVPVQASISIILPLLLSQRQDEVRNRIGHCLCCLVSSWARLPNHSIQPDAVGSRGE